MLENYPSVSTYADFETPRPNLLRNGSFKRADRWGGNPVTNKPTTIYMIANGWSVYGNTSHALVDGQANNAYIPSGTVLTIKAKTDAPEVYMQQFDVNLWPVICGKVVTASIMIRSDTTNFADPNVLGQCRALIINHNASAVIIAVNCKVHPTPWANHYIMEATWECPEWSANANNTTAGLRFQFPKTFNGYVCNPKLELGGYRTEFVPEDFGTNNMRCDPYGYIDWTPTWGGAIGNSTRQVNVRWRAALVATPNVIARYMSDVTPSWTSINSYGATFHWYEVADNNRDRGIHNLKIFCEPNYTEN